MTSRGDTRGEKKPFRVTINYPYVTCFYAQETARYPLYVPPEEEYGLRWADETYFMQVRLVVLEHYGDEEFNELLRKIKSPLPSHLRYSASIEEDASLHMRWNGERWRFECP